MKANAMSPSIDAQNAHALLDRRYAERASVCHRVTYGAEDDFDACTTEGRICDLSKTGCQIVSVTPPLLGSHLALTLYLPDGKPPLCLVGATVCRVNGNVWGVTFPPLTSDERRRVLEMVLRRVSLSSSVGQRAAFRIV